MANSTIITLSLWPIIFSSQWIAHWLAYWLYSCVISFVFIIIIAFFFIFLLVSFPPFFAHRNRMLHQLAYLTHQLAILWIVRLCSLTMSQIYYQHRPHHPLMMHPLLTHLLPLLLALSHFSSQILLRLFQALQCSQEGEDQNLVSWAPIFLPSFLLLTHSLIYISNIIYCNIYP